MSRGDHSPNEFTTIHISLASFLRYAGIPHIATLKRFAKSYRFVFDDTDDQCRKLEYDFLSGCAVADAMALLEADRELKQTIKVASESGRWDTEEERGIH